MPAQNHHLYFRYLRVRVETSAPVLVPQWLRALH